MRTAGSSLGAKLEGVTTPAEDACVVIVRMTTVTLFACLRNPKRFAAGGSGNSRRRSARRPPCLFVRTVADVRDVDRFAGAL
jgi:hypothetical protein